MTRAAVDKPVASTRAAVRKPAASPRLVKRSADGVRVASNAEGRAPHNAEGGAPSLAEGGAPSLAEGGAPSLAEGSDASNIDAPLAALAPFDALGDAVVLIDRRQGIVVGGTAALAQLLEAAGVNVGWPAPLPAWGAALPGLIEGVDAMHEARAPMHDDAIAPSRSPPRGWRCGAAEDLSIEAMVLDRGDCNDYNNRTHQSDQSDDANRSHQHDIGTRWLLLRLRDDRQHRREQREALRRQLHDRESLLFTSRSVSVGEVGSVLAHELNQPIGAVANLLRGLRLRVARRAQGGDDGASEELQAIERAIDQVMFAARVIQRIREFTHARAPQLEALDLVHLLHASATLLDWDWQRTGVALELDIPAGPVHVRGDQTMLQQVVANLMRNALDALREHPPASPHVVLALRRQGEEAIVSIADNGAGMSEQAEQRLFVPFTSTKPTGLGIGLSICRSFVELHQGRLWFTRNDAGGCTFHFRLPLADAAAAKAVGGAARGADSQSTQDTRDTQDTQNTQDTQDTQDTQGAQATTSGAQTRGAVS